MPKTKITYRELAENFVATRSHKDYNAIYNRYFKNMFKLLAYARMA